MAQSRLPPIPISGRPSDQSEGGGRVWKWVFLSGFAHVVVIAVLLIVPFLPSKAPNYPVYTVDLVGGEKLGGGAGTEIAPAPKVKPVPEVKEVKKEAKKVQVEAPPPPKPAKESKKKIPEVRAEMTEKIAAAKAKAKKEAEQAEAEQVREKLKQLRERRIEEALAEIKSRAQVEEKDQQQQKQQQQQPKAAAAPATSTVVADKPGAAAPGVGGTGGGVVKGPEFVRYTNIIKDRVKNSWTWPERRTDLKITVNVSIQENGEITGVRLVGTSGDRSFDDSVIRAIRKANPLPPPPEDYRADFLNVVLSFNSKDLGS